MAAEGAVPAVVIVEVPPAVEGSGAGTHPRAPSAAGQARRPIVLAVTGAEQLLQLLAAADSRGCPEWAERERCPIEQGRNFEGLAEVAERRGEQQRAMQYLDRAGALFSRYGAKLQLDQVLAKKQILKA